MSKNLGFNRLLAAMPYLLPALIIFAVFTYFPLARVIYMSFTDADFLKPTPNWIGLENYRMMFKRLLWLEWK